MRFHKESAYDLQQNFPIEPDPANMLVSHGTTFNVIYISIEIMTPILLVEDNPGDAQLVLYAARQVGLNTPIVICETGDEALDYLYAEGSYENAERPYLVLLDLNLPGLNGHEVLQEIKEDARLKSIPVVILSTSADERDVEFCYRYGANSYMKKVADRRTMVRHFERFKSFWIDTAMVSETSAASSRSGAAGAC